MVPSSARKQMQTRKVGLCDTGTGRAVRISCGTDDGKCWWMCESADYEIKTITTIYVVS